MWPYLITAKGDIDRARSKLGTGKAAASGREINNQLVNHSGGKSNNSNDNRLSYKSGKSWLQLITDNSINHSRSEQKVAAIDYGKMRP